MTEAAALPLSKYHQVYLVLLEQLRDGRFADGLPGELALAREFGVGRVTVRRALEQLARQGLIVRGGGRRTRPAAPAPQPVPRPRPAAGPATPLEGLFGDIVSATRGTTSKVLEWSVVPAAPDLAQVLQVAPGDKLRKAVRRRSSAAGPVSHITTYVPEPLARGLRRTGLARKPMLQLLQEAGLQPGRAVQSVSARQADTRVAAELQVPVGAALLWVRRVVYDTQERPVQLLHGLYRPDRYEYRMEWSQAGAVDAHIAAGEAPALKAGR